MTANEFDRQALQRCCLGNQEAIQFLLLWREYVHAIDDIIDGEEHARTPEFWLRTFASAATLYSDPFYLRNVVALRQLVYNCTNAYADSVAWERSPEEWRRQFSDSYRHFGSEMVLAVAALCGGYNHMRAISPELRVICYREHHDNQGNAI